jgi:hypothetical protein
VLTVRGVTSALVFARHEREWQVHAVELVDHQ